jgi:SAM-dependent methyltransferase
MSIYDDLGVKYDRMVRWKQRLEREAPFIQRLFGEMRAKRVLDLGCATGHHAQLFRNWGLEVVGVDPSPALLEIARDSDENRLNFETDINKPIFIEGDFDNFAQRVDGEFDVILSLGNTLPHLENASTLEKLLQNVHNKLKPRGAFVFQNRNYDKLLISRDRFQLPTTFREGEQEELFFRFYDFLKAKIQFNIVHFKRVNDSWIEEIHSTLLTPWKQSDLERQAKAAGFPVRNWYGDFSGSPFDPSSSNDLIGLFRRDDG